MSYVSVNQMSRTALRRTSSCSNHVYSLGSNGLLGYLESGEVKANIFCLAALLFFFFCSNAYSKQDGCKIMATEGARIVQLNEDLQSVNEAAGSSIWSCTATQRKEDGCKDMVANVTQRIKRDEEPRSANETVENLISSCIAVRAKISDKRSFDEAQQNWLNRNNSICKNDIFCHLEAYEGRSLYFAKKWEILHSEETLREARKNRSARKKFQGVWEYCEFHGGLPSCRTIRIVQFGTVLCGDLYERVSNQGFYRQFIAQTKSALKAEIIMVCWFGDCVESIYENQFDSQLDDPSIWQKARQPISIKKGILTSGKNDDRIGHFDISPGGIYRPMRRDELHELLQNEKLIERCKRQN